MKVSLLEGPQLDYWAAKADGKDGPVEWGIGWSRNFQPSINWSEGGPIIEREHIGISYGKIMRDPGGPSMEWTAHRTWVTSEGIIRYHDNQQSGDTPLIAAMRCFVTSKFGQYVTEE